jgi:hypothetical protein
MDPKPPASGQLMQYIFPRRQRFEGRPFAGPGPRALSAPLRQFAAPRLTLGWTRAGAFMSPFPLLFLFPFPLRYQD